MFSLRDFQRLRAVSAMLLPCAGILFQIHAMPTPWLHAEGRWIKDPAGNNVILRGVDLPGLEQLNGGRGPNMSVSAMIDTLTNETHGWYARILRLCVDPDPFFSNPDQYFGKNLKPALDQCAAKGIYCIVDLHYVATAASVSANVAKFWTYVAPKIKTYPNVIIEYMNENSDNESWSQWRKAYAQPWYDTVRALAPQNLILIGGPQWNTIMGGAASDPVIGTNIFYCAHFYPQSNSSLWSANGDVTKAARAVPFFVSEWGYIKGGAIPTSGTQTGFGEPFKAWLNQMRIGWTAWCADNSWDPKMFDGNWNLLTGENYQGGFVKQFLAENRDNDLPAGITTIGSNLSSRSNKSPWPWIGPEGFSADGRRVSGWRSGAELFIK